MKCPLFVVHHASEPGNVDLVKLDCLKEECAWWDPKYKMCSVLSICGALEASFEGVKAIILKMPHEARP